MLTILCCEKINAKPRLSNVVLLKSIQESNDVYKIHQHIFYARGHALLYIFYCCLTYPQVCTSSTALLIAHQHQMGCNQLPHVLSQKILFLKPKSFLRNTIVIGHIGKCFGYPKLQHHIKILASPRKWTSISIGKSNSMHLPITVNIALVSLSYSSFCATLQFSL